MRLFVHRFVLSGLNLERFLNTLQQKGVQLTDVQRTDDRSVECVCLSRDLPAIRTLAEEKGCRVHGEEPRRVSALLAGIRRRPGVPAGALLALIMVITLSQFIWHIEINGARAYHADIRAYLQQSGYRAGMLRSTIDAKKLEGELLYRYPDIAWFQVHADGMTLVVDVAPGVPAPQPEKQQSGHVYAQRGGIVHTVRVHAGTANVKAGDVVMPGDVLILGQERAADGETVAVQAQGVIMARCWGSACVKMPLYEIASEETGREAVAVQIRTPFGLWPQSLPSPHYLAYNTYVEQMPVGGCFFPLQMERSIRREVALQYTPRDPAKVREEAAQAALKQLKSGLFGYEIIDKWVDYCMIEGDVLAATATAEWLMDIGGQMPP